MNDSNDELKATLKIAEQTIEQLHQENQEMVKAYQDNMDAQMVEAEQMVQLTEQIWKLEEALAMSQEKAMAQLQQMKGKFNEVQTHMQATLKAATENASSMELAARVYEMSEAANVNELDDQLAEFNQTLAPGKLD
ncbi:MAG: hypothetical protein HOL37_01720 [Rhodospirillaceae bacterium]|jgi:hypothetical protein|nr:hypothetical protein [Rhodospirillaceae bacterium]MBT4220354.1 hypothetical protein [Rhodospirillaceae bacterium]MBT4464657.1 hypothetical protein [Rhodospirillaceae bacterium]MBT5013021.1 hypothetical protein [Rhodospirillaceae bacterium]MBT5308029.1 hypothetical protein [Rhodospirillaceae bacterium]